MSDPTGPDLLDEQMDRRLKEYGARWRAEIPGPASVVAPSGGARHRWLVPAAAAAAVAVVVGIAYGATRGDDDAGGPASGGPSPSVGTDDTCDPGDLVASDRQLTTAGPTRVLSARLTIVPGRSTCVVDDFPGIELLDHGVVIPVRTTHDGLDPGGTTVFAPGEPVGVELTWSPSGRLCRSLDNDEVRITVGDGAAVTIDGFGGACVPSGEQPPPVRVLPFLQVDRGGDTKARGTVTGTVTLEGGPAPGTSTPVTSGTVELIGRSSGGGVSIGPDGTFRVEVPPGRYQVTVSTPQWNDGAPYDDGKYGVTGGADNELDIHIPIR